MLRWKRKLLVMFSILLCISCSLLEHAIAAETCTEHVPGVPVGVTESTCTQTGYTGDIYCKVCNKRLSKGEMLAKLPHQLGEPIN